MDYLARREHSYYELVQKLCKKFPEVDRNLLTSVLDKLRSQGLQSDQRFAESYVRYRKSRGFAYTHIEADLLARQVLESTIGKYLQREDTHWQQAATALVDKKMRSQQAIQHGSKMHLKLSRFLESRGFGPLEIRCALEKHMA